MKAKTIKLFALSGAAALVIATGCGRDPYDNPIANNSEQPDKILFDRAIRDIEKHRYDLGRITLQTLINTYPDSEYIAKSKLAIADSWYREGTSHALAQERVGVLEGKAVARDLDGLDAVIDPVLVLVPHVGPGFGHRGDRRGSGEERGGKRASSSDRHGDESPGGALSPA